MLLAILIVFNQLWLNSLSSVSLNFELADILLLTPNFALNFFYCQINSSLRENFQKIQSQQKWKFAFFFFFFWVKGWLLGIIAYKIFLSINLNIKLY